MSYFESIKAEFCAHQLSLQETLFKFRRMLENGSGDPALLSELVRDFTIQVHLTVELE